MTISIELAITLILALVAIITLALKLRSVASGEGKNDGKIEEKLDNISSAVVGVDKKIDGVDKKVDGVSLVLHEHRERIVRVETCLEMKGLLGQRMTGNEEA